MDKKQVMKKILSVMCFTIILCIALKCFQLAVVDDFSSRIRVQFKEFYEQENIDTLILGASPAVRGFNVKMMEEEGIKNTFSLATSNQIAIGGYYLLKEALKYHDIDTVIYHTSAVRFKPEDSERPYNLQGNYLILDEMRFSANKLQYAYDALGEFAYVDLLSQYQRGKENLSLDGMISNVIKKVTNKDYRTYYENATLSVLGGMDVYGGKGYCYLTQPMAKGTAEIREREFVADSEQFDYLRETIELCKKNGIEFILVQVPSYPVEIYRDVEEYKEAEGVFEEIAKTYEIPYWNFNYVKKEYLDLKESDFNDSSHLRKGGSDTFTSFFVNVFKEYDSDENCFAKYTYENWEELEKEHQEVYGLKQSLTAENGGITINTTVAAAEGVEVVYCYRLYKDYELMEETEWTAEDSHYFSALENGEYYVCTLAKEAGSREEYQAISQKKKINLY